MFNLGKIWAYPTDTSFGLGVRVDDSAGLEKLKKLKNRPSEKYFSVMVRDWEMLQQYAEVPEGLNLDWFLETPRTALLKPTDRLPETGFWPSDKVAFRVCTLPEVAQHITVPVTATSANISGAEPIYCTKNLFNIFNDQINICDLVEDLPAVAASEIWDWTTEQIIRLR